MRGLFFLVDAENHEIFVIYFFVHCIYLTTNHGVIKYLKSERGSYGNFSVCAMCIVISDWYHIDIYDGLHTLL